MALQRQVQKNLYQSYTKFENVAEMVTRAVHPTRPSLLKSLQKNRDKMDSAFEELHHAFSLYRREELQNVSEEEFNEIEDEGGAKYEFNDAWYSTNQNKYYDLVEKSDEKIYETRAIPSVSEETEAKVKQTEALVSEEKMDTRKKTFSTASSRP